ncbi:MAG: patatin-like phospholipase family protein [Syntrophobacterales bacterium]|nr:MAG: patatin-like phospholipase family protein [Syntrophobacterales bacterium]
MSENLSFSAGRKALTMIREGGLNPDQVKVVTGAAGGAKCLILNHLDGAIFTTWFAGRKEPLFLLGSSAAAWRFACVSQEKPLDAIDRFQTTYVNQRYSEKPSTEEITGESISFLNIFLGDRGEKEILSHPYLRMSIMATRCRGLAASDRKGALLPGIIIAALLNIVSRRSLGLFFERTLLYDQRDTPPFFDMDGFPIRKAPLTGENLKPALLASGSIPVVMSRVTDIPGAPKGTYRDGGIIDYHMDVPFTKDGDGIVLFPHYMSRIIPGWFDKHLPWRKPDPAHMENLLLLHPTEAFMQRLPYGKAPDRGDFHLFKGRDAERIDFWSKAIQESRRLSEDFLDAVESGKIRELVKPLPE